MSFWEFTWRHRLIQCCLQYVFEQADADLCFCVTALYHDYDHKDYLELGADESGIDALQDRINELQDRIDCLEEWEDIQDELGDQRDDLDNLEFDRTRHNDW